MTATIEGQLEKAQVAEAALVAEVTDLEGRIRGLAFDALADPKARGRLTQMETDLESRRRMLALSRVAIEEGERRLGVQAGQEAEQHLAALDAERVRLHAERDDAFYAVETLIETLAATVGIATTLDAQLKNVERRLDLPTGRHAGDAVSRYASHHLVRAGLRFDFPYREQGGQPISDKRNREVREAEEAEAAQQVADEAARECAEQEVREEAARRVAEQAAPRDDVEQMDELVGIATTATVERSEE